MRPAPEAALVVVVAAADVDAAVDEAALLMVDEPDEATLEADDDAPELVEAEADTAVVAPEGVAVMLIGVPLDAHVVAPYDSAAESSVELHVATWQL